MNRSRFCLGAVALLAALPGPAVAKSYFSVRPPNATFYYVTGVLTHYGIGNGVGTIKILDSSGTEVRIRAARTVRINGVAVNCGEVDACPEWPTNIVLGATVVTATCWKQPLWSSVPMLVTDQIDVGTSAQARRRKRR